MKKTVIFDWSGVIGDIVPVMLCIVNYIFTKNGGREITKEELQKEWEEPYMKFYNKYLPELTLERENFCFGEARSICPQSKPYQDVVSVLKDLKQRGLEIVVLTAEPREVIWPEVQAFGLQETIDKMYNITHDKSLYISKIMEEYIPSNTVIVGDSEAEILAGQKVGIKTIAVTWGLKGEEDLRALSPDFIARTTEDLRQILINLPVGS